MAKSTVITETKTVTIDGVVTSTVVDNVSPDQIADLLFRGAASAKYGAVPDNTSIVNRGVKRLLIFPFTEL